MRPCPATLDQEFIKDLFKVTGDGKAKDFEDIRDHAIIRVLTEGVRRIELEVRARPLLGTARPCPAWLPSCPAFRLNNVRCARSCKAMGIRHPRGHSVRRLEVTSEAGARMRRRKVLGGLIHGYERAA
jgi:hypothetical protein